MQIAAAETRHGSGKQRWMRTVMLTAGLVLLVASSVQPAGAEEKDPRNAAENQIKGCALAGGGSEVDVERTVEGIQTTTVKCVGGLLDGVECFNIVGASRCYLSNVKNVRPDVGARAPLAEVAEVFESGSLAQIKVTIAAYEAELASDQVIARAASAQNHDQDHDRDSHQSKGKKDHKGKKGGKARRK